MGILSIFATAFINRKTKQNSEVRGVGQLPNHIVALVLGFVDVEKLLECAFVCRLWFSIAHREHLWKQLCQRVFPHEFALVEQRNKAEGDTKDADSLLSLPSPPPPPHLFCSVTPSTWLSWKPIVQRLYLSRFDERVNPKHLSYDNKAQIVSKLGNVPETTICMNRGQLGGVGYFEIQIEAMTDEMYVGVTVTPLLAHVSNADIVLHPLVWQYGDGHSGRPPFEFGGQPVWPSGVEMDYTLDPSPFTSDADTDEKLVRYGVGDVISILVDAEREGGGVVNFFKNGRWIGNNERHCRLPPRCQFYVYAALDAALDRVSFRFNPIPPILQRNNENK